MSVIVPLTDDIRVVGAYISRVGIAIEELVRAYAKEGEGLFTGTLGFSRIPGSRLAVWVD